MGRCGRWIRALIEEGVQELQEFRSCRMGNARVCRSNIIMEVDRLPSVESNLAQW